MATGISGTTLPVSTSTTTPSTIKLEEDSVDIIFHGIPYNLSITVAEHNQPEGTLCIDLENLTTNENWHGEFTSSYIENITSKTGSFKRFSVLIKMLMNALRQQTETVFLDLLTYSDLEALRSKKNGTNNNSTTTVPKTKSPTTGPGMNKRYLILTYVVEFDRVHYPLPLTYEDTPTLSIYQRLTRRLRRELLTYKSLAGLSESSIGLTANGLPNSATTALSSSVAGLQRENTVLRQMLIEQESKNTYAQDTIRTLETKILGLQDTVNAGETALEKLRLASRAEVKRLRQELQDCHNKLGITNSSSLHDHHNNDNYMNQQDTYPNSKEIITSLQESNEQLKLRVQELTKQLALSSSNNKTHTNSSVSRGRTTNRTPTSSNHPLNGPHNNSASSVSRRSTSNNSRGLSPLSAQNSIQSTKSSSQGQNRLNQAASIYSNNRHPTPTRRTNTTHGTTTPTNNTRHRTPTNNTRTPGSQYGTPNSTASGPRGGVSSRTPRSASGTPSNTGTGRTTQRTTVNNQNNSRSSRSVTPSGRSVSSQPSVSSHHLPSPTNINYQKSQSSQNSNNNKGGRTPTGNRQQNTNVASPYLTGVAPILATMEKNYKQRTDNVKSSTHSTPTGGRQTNTNIQQQRQQQQNIYSTKSSRGPSPARTHTSNTSNNTTNAPPPPPVPAMVKDQPSSTTSSTITMEPPVIPRTVWNETNDNNTIMSQNNNQSNSNQGSGTVSPGGTKYSYDSSAEMQDIDARLQQLQDFLKAAKSGGPLPNLNTNNNTQSNGMGM